MAGTPLTMEQKHRLFREAMYDKAVDCIHGRCHHKNKTACTESWFQAARDIMPRRRK